jgi:hypothetical protein
VQIAQAGRAGLVLPDEFKAALRHPV